MLLGRTRRLVNKGTASYQMHFPVEKRIMEEVEQRQGWGGKHTWVRTAASPLISRRVAVLLTPCSSGAGGSGTHLLAGADGA